MWRGLRKFPYVSLVLLGWVCYIASLLFLADGGWMIPLIALGGALAGLLVGALLGAVIGAVVGELQTEMRILEGVIGGAGIGAALLGTLFGLGTYFSVVFTVIGSDFERKLVLWHNYFLAIPLLITAAFAPIFVIPLIVKIGSVMKRRGYGRRVVISTLVLTGGLGITLGFLT